MCLYGDCITSEPAVLVSLDALRYSDSNEMCSSPFCCQTATCTLFSSSNILGVHVLTGCDTMLPLSDKGINICWKIAIKYANLLSGVVRDDNVERLYVRCMGLEKMMSEVLMKPCIVFL